MGQEQDIAAKLSNSKVTQKVMKSWQSTVDIISYKGIVSNIPYFIFVAILGIIYISNSNKSISIMREISKKNKELKELRWRYKDAQANLIFHTSETEVINRASSIGIQPLEKPAYEIKKLELIDSTNIKP